MRHHLCQPKRCSLCICWAYHVWYNPAHDAIWLMCRLLNLKWYRWDQ